MFSALVRNDLTPDPDAELTPIAPTSPEDAIAEVRLLREELADLRGRLAHGGEPAPPRGDDGRTPS